MNKLCLLFRGCLLVGLSHQAHATDWRSVPIAAAGLSPRLSRALEDMNFRAVDDLSLADELDLKSISNVGPLTIGELRDFIARNRLPVGRSVFDGAGLRDRLILHHAGVRTLEDYFANERFILTHFNLNARTHARRGAWAARVNAKSKTRRSRDPLIQWRLRPLDSIGLSHPVSQSLVSWDLHTVGELMLVKNAELLLKLGELHLDEIQERLARRGLALNQSPFKDLSLGLRLSLYRFNVRSFDELVARGESLSQWLDLSEVRAVTARATFAPRLIPVDAKNLPTFAFDWSRYPLDQTDLPVKVINLLKDAGAHTVGEVLLADRDELLEIPRLGRGSLIDVQMYLQRRSIRWGPSDFHEVAWPLRIALLRRGVRSLEDLFADEARVRAAGSLSEEIAVRLPRWRDEFAARGPSAGAEVDGIVASLIKLRATHGTPAVREALDRCEAALRDGSSG